MTNALSEHHTAAWIVFFVALAVLNVLTQLWVGKNSDDGSEKTDNSNNSGAIGKGARNVKAHTYVETSIISSSISGESDKGPE